MKTAWLCLEAIPGLVALEPDWQSQAGEQFPALRSLCLQPASWSVRSLPCPHGCGCDHFIIPRHDGTGAVATCCCHPPICPDIPLTLQQTIPLEVNRPRLAHAICKAFGLSSKFSEVPALNSLQVGSWSANPVPAILTVHAQRTSFRRAVAELAAQLRQPFILFAPTSDFLDAPSQSILENHGASFFALNSHVILNDDGTLQATRSPAHLFARFSPESEKPTGPPPPKIRFALRKGLGFWRLTFDGQETHLRHERGLFYVSWLLHNPDQPIHALDLAAKIPEIYRQQLGLASVTDPTTGKSASLPSHARIQERSLALDDAQTMRALFRKEKELEAILDSEEESEPVKAEALRELEAIAEFQRQHGRQSNEGAQRATNAVRKAINRLHQRMANSLNNDGSPHSVLCPFASHLQSCIIAPSRIPAGPQASRYALLYQPPPGVIWSDH